MAKKKSVNRGPTRKPGKSKKKVAAKKSVKSVTSQKKTASVKSASSAVPKVSSASKRKVVKKGPPPPASVLDMSDEEFDKQAETQVAASNPLMTLPKVENEFSDDYEPEYVEDRDKDSEDEAEEDDDEGYF